MIERGPKIEICKYCNQPMNNHAPDCSLLAVMMEGEDLRQLEAQRQILKRRHQERSEMIDDESKIKAAQGDINFDDQLAAILTSMELHEESTAKVESRGARMIDVARKIKKEGGILKSVKTKLDNIRNEAKDSTEELALLWQIYFTEMDICITKLFLTSQILKEKITQGQDFSAITKQVEELEIRIQSLKDYVDGYEKKIKEN